MNIEDMLNQKRKGGDMARLSRPRRCRSRRMKRLIRFLRNFTSPASYTLAS